MNVYNDYTDQSFPRSLLSTNYYNNGTASRHNGLGDSCSGGNSRFLFVAGNDFEVALGLRIAQIEMRGQVHAVGSLVERTVESGDEEHKYLGAHTDEKHQVGPFNMGELEERSQNHYGGTPAVGVVQERLAGYAVHPLLQAVDEIEFTVCCHLDDAARSAYLISYM